jgi:hypothetical protein
VNLPKGFQAIDLNLSSPSVAISSLANTIAIALLTNRNCKGDSFIDRISLQSRRNESLYNHRNIYCKQVKAAIHIFENI